MKKQQLFFERIKMLFCTKLMYFLIFLIFLKEKSNYYSGIKRESYTDLAFSTKLTSHDQIICILVLAECPNFYRKIPKIDIHFPTAAKCIQLVNDYRLSHSMNELKLCHQWCRFADKYANKMMNREIELDDQKITTKPDKMVFKKKMQNFRNSTIVFKRICKF